MRRTLLSIFSVAVLGCNLCFDLKPAQARPLTSATIQRRINTVKLLLQGKSPRDAHDFDVLRLRDALSTGRSSQAQLKFNDGSVARVGELALFSFIPNTREFNLRNGTALFIIPPKQGRTYVRTPHGSAGIRGSALFVRMDAEKDITIIGALTNNPDGDMEISTTGSSQNIPLKAGQLAIISNGKIELFKFDLKEFYRTSKLVRGFNLDKQDAPSADPDVAKVQVETLEALAGQIPLAGKVIENPSDLKLSSGSLDRAMGINVPRPLAPQPRDVVLGIDPNNNPPDRLPEGSDVSRGGGSIPGPSEPGDGTGGNPQKSGNPIPHDGPIVSKSGPLPGIQEKPADPPEAIPKPDPSLGPAPTPSKDPSTNSGSGAAPGSNTPSPNPGLGTPGSGQSTPNSAPNSPVGSQTPISTPITSTVTPTSPIGNQTPVSSSPTAPTVTTTSPIGSQTPVSTPTTPTVTSTSPVGSQTPVSTPTSSIGSQTPVVSTPIIPTVTSTSPVGSQTPVSAPTTPTVTSVIAPTTPISTPISTPTTPTVTPVNTPTTSIATPVSTPTTPTPGLGTPGTTLTTTPTTPALKDPSLPSSTAIVTPPNSTPVPTPALTTTPTTPTTTTTQTQAAPNLAPALSPSTSQVLETTAPPRSTTPATPPATN